LTLLQVRSAWGGSSSFGAKVAASYGANAYMLMYRKYDPARNQPVPPDDAVPPYIRDEVAKGEAEAAKKLEVGAPVASACVACLPLPK